jgi:hypothetical protein
MLNEPKRFKNFWKSVTVNDFNLTIKCKDEAQFETLVKYMKSRSNEIPYNDTGNQDTR